jgi:hypothetical protein
VPNQDESGGEAGSQTALQARVDFHQALLKEYRTRGYQIVLAHAGLAIGAGKYAADRTGPEAFAIAIGMLFVTTFLYSWLSRLQDKSDGHRDDALALYARLGVALNRDAEHRHSQRRLWGPFVAFPWAVLVGLWIWIVGAHVPTLCVFAR